MKKCILSCLLVLALLLTLLPPALAAGPDGSVNAEQSDQPTLVAQWMQNNGNTWEKFKEEREWLNLPDFGGSSDLAQRIWIQDGAEKYPVTSVTSENGCYEIQKIEYDGGYLFLFTAVKLGEDVLRFTAGTHSIAYPVSSTPYSAFYSTGAISQAAFCGSNQCDLTLTGSAQSVWFLTQASVTELVSLKLNGQELTAADGSYTYRVNEQTTLRAEWAAREDGTGYGLKLTALSGGLTSNCAIGIELHAKSDTVADNAYHGTLVLHPDYRIYISSVGLQGDAPPYTPTSFGEPHLAQSFDVSDKTRTTMYAFYYYNPAGGSYTELPVGQLRLTNRDGSAVTDGISLTRLTASQQLENPAENMAELRCWALGEYTLSCTWEGQTYSQPVSVALPYTGLFTDSTYDLEHYIVNRRYERPSSEQGKPLTLWLLRQDGFRNDEISSVEVNGQPLDEAGFVTLDGKELQVQFELRKLSGEGDRSGLQIDFPDGELLDELLEKNNLSFLVEFSSRSNARFSIVAGRRTPSGPTAEPGKNSGSTESAADGAVTPGGGLYVRYENSIYFLAMSLVSDGGALDPLRGSLGSRFDADAVSNGWASGFDLRLAAFAVQENGTLTEEARGMLPTLVSNAAFRLTDQSYSEGSGFLSWNDPVSPTDDAPYYQLYLCFAPRDGDGYLSADLTLREGAVCVQQTGAGIWEAATDASATFTLGLQTRIQKTTMIDCAEKQLDTMEKLNKYLAEYSFPAGTENKIEIRLAPVAYEGVLRFNANRPTEQNAETAAMYIMGTVDEASRTITTIYGGVEIGGRVQLLSDLYLKPHTDDTKNLKDADGKTVGLRSTQPVAPSNVSDVTFDGFDVGLDCGGNGYTVARSCVFKNCKTGVRIDSGAMHSGNANSEWPHNTFYGCEVGVDLISLPTYISPYQLRFYENNFLRNGTDIRVPENFSDTYYFYRNFFGTLTGELTGFTLEDAAYQPSKIEAPEGTVIVSPRRKYPLWVDSTTLSINKYQPALLPETGEPAVQALLAAPMLRAAAFAAARPADKTQLTIEGKTVILNDQAAENIITDPEAFQNGAEITVAARSQSSTQTLGTWRLEGSENSGFNAGLGQYTALDSSISFTVAEQPVLDTLCPTLTIPVSDDWKAAYLTGPDVRQQYVPVRDGGLTFPVTAGGQYTLAKADAPVLAYDPAIRGTTFSAALDTANFESLNGAAVILAVYGENGQLLACRAAERDGSVCSAALSDAVLSKAARFKLFTLDPQTAKPLYAAQSWSSGELSN